MNDGSYWGVTTIDGKQGWVNLDEVNNPDLRLSTSLLLSMPRPILRLTTIR